MFVWVYLLRLKIREADRVFHIRFYASAEQGKDSCGR